MDAEITGLEHKLAALLADYHRLRAENDSLKRELGRSQEQLRAQTARMNAASTRLDALVAQLTESAA